MPLSKLTAPVILMVLSAASALASEGGVQAAEVLEETKATGSPATTATESVERPTRIQWFGTLEQGLAEAERSGRPVLLSAATLRCDGVPGKW